MGWPGQTVLPIPDRKNGMNLIPSRYHWDQLDAKVIVLDINFPVRLSVKRGRGRVGSWKSQFANIGRIIRQVSQQ
jgi:hypothetical protein